MTDYGKYILEEVKGIKEKNEVIKKAKLDYKSFNEYRLMMAQIESFDINKNYSDSELLKKLNDFISQVDKSFEAIIERNHLRQGFDLSLSNEACFYEALKQISLFSQKDFSKEEAQNFLEELYTLKENKDFAPHQNELLEEAMMILEENLSSDNQKRIMRK